MTKAKVGNVKKFVDKNKTMLNTGIIDRLEDFGIEITLDTCPFHTPILAKETAVVMTDSGKCSYYSPGELDVEVAFSTVADCVRSAVASTR